MKELKNIIRKILQLVGFFKVQAIIRTFAAQKSLKRNKFKNSGNGVIKIAFIVYEPAMWDKQEPVFLKMLEHHEIVPYLIVVPDVNGSLEEQKIKTDFFVKKYDNVLVFSKEVLQQFKNGEFHYTFYQTPYNYKYPKSIRPPKLVSKTKICFIPYAYIGSDKFIDVSSQNAFFENVYFGFMDSEPMVEILNKKFETTCQQKLQHFLFLGYPSLEFYLDLNSESSSLKKVLWLPRWDPHTSNFLEYKDLISNLSTEMPELDLTIRPHPLMFGALSSLGLMSEESTIKYKESLIEKNIHLDEHNLLNDTLINTDIMIADYSSVIIMYFLSGRPIIYCDSGIEPSGIYSIIQPTLYIAKSFEEVKIHLENLKNGIDPKAQERKKIIEAEAAKHRNSAERIVNTIIKDYKD